jgi:hypothetical protein
MTFTLKETNLGLSVFSDQAYKPGDTIFKFTGPLLNFNETINNDKKECYLQIDYDLYLGPSGGIDDYINHSCDPNAGIRLIDGEFILIAIKPISANEEIFFDYSTYMDENNWEIPCECGSPNCRGIIRDFKTLPQDLQDKYLELDIVGNFLKNK